MAKYSYELKLQVVQDYLEGKGSYSYLAKQYGVLDSFSVQEWVGKYQQFGEEGLYRKRQRVTYSVQFKLHAIDLYLTTELSHREAAKQLGLSNFSLLTRWVREFRESGPEGLSKPKGRPPSMSKKKQSHKKPVSKPEEEETTRIEELEKQVRYLQIENTF